MSSLKRLLGKMAKTELHKMLLKEGFFCISSYSFKSLGDDREVEDLFFKDVGNRISEYGSDMLRDCLIVTTDALFERGARRNPNKVYIYIRKFLR